MSVLPRAALLLTWFASEFGGLSSVQLYSMPLDPSKARDALAYSVFRELDGKRREIRKSEVEERLIQKLSAMSEGLASNLTPEQLTDLIAYLQSLK